jgi:type II secretory pathway pseudopilin PulG
MSKLRSELTNLLPRSAMRALRREYFVRLITLAVMLAVVVIIIHGVLLIPAYMYTRADVMLKQNELNTIVASASTAEEQEINARIARAQSDITYLGRLQTQSTASGAVRALISIAHPGIKLSGFSYTAPTTASGPASMGISGVADTRDALRSYVDALSHLPYVTKADLPISAYAKENAIPFTITVTGTLRP